MGGIIFFEVFVSQGESRIHTRQELVKSDVGKAWSPLRGS